MSRIGLGLMRISEMSVDDVEKYVLKCVDNGVNFIDLADIYGRTKCETIFGSVLKRNPDLRKRIYLQTKVGIIPGHGYDLSYEYIIKATKDCIERLHCGYLDSLLLHRPDIFMDSEEIAKAINELVDEGLIKDFGVSNFSQSEIEYLKKDLKVKIKYNQVQLGIGNTDMIDQTMYTNIPSHIASKEADSLFFYLKKEGIIIQCWSPYQYGFFEGSIFNSEKYPKINEALQEMADKYHTSKCAIATSFLLMLDKNLIVISGSTDYTHLKDSIDGEDIVMTKREWYELYNKTGHMLP